MKIADILESKNIQEGPLDAVGRAVGKTIGGVAKAAGAVAGVKQGVKKAFQKGKQASINTIAGEPTPQTKATGNTTAGDTMKRAADTPGAPSSFKQAAKSAGQEFMKGFRGDKSTTPDADVMRQIKSLNKQQKQQLYNML